MTLKVEQFTKRLRKQRYRETIGPQRRGLGKEKTTKNSRTRTSGDYSSNVRRGI
jgi:hypothetical protein